MSFPSCKFKYANAILILLLSAFAELKLCIVKAGVMGLEDGRIEAFQLPTEWQEMAAATIAFVPAQHFSKSNEAGATFWQSFFYGIALKNDPDFSPSVHPLHRFGSEPRIAMCTGFMVTSQLMVTAAHCLPEDGNLAGVKRDTHLVSGLGYANERALQDSPLDFKIDDERVNHMAEVLFLGKAGSEQAGFDQDFALIKLAKPYLQLKPIRLKAEFAADYPAPLAILGHPLGLPLKADLTGKVAQKTDSKQKVMLSFLDTGGGNSGGPVFDLLSKEVVGLLVASTPDWSTCGARGTPAGEQLCENRRPETLAQFASDKNVPKSVIASFQKKYPSGIITAYAQKVLRIDAVIQKLNEVLK